MYQLTLEAHVRLQEAEVGDLQTWVDDHDSEGVEWGWWTTGGTWLQIPWQAALDELSTRQGWQTQAVTRATLRQPPGPTLR